MLLLGRFGILDDVAQLRFQVLDFCFEVPDDRLRFDGEHLGR